MRQTDDGPVERSVHRDMATTAATSKYAAIEPMFEHGVDPRHALLRAFEPGKPVWVDLRQLYRDTMSPAGRSSMFVVRHGLDRNQRVAGALHAWMRTSCRRS